MARRNNRIDEHVSISIAKGALRECLTLSNAVFYLKVIHDEGSAYLPSDLLQNFTDEFLEDFADIVRNASDDRVREVLQSLCDVEDRLFPIASPRAKAKKSTAKKLAITSTAAA